MPDYFRRRLLMALALSPLLPALPGRAAPAVDVQRIVALEWLPVELLMALGVTPMGVADLFQYRLWVGEPALPPSTVEIGLRTEPNLELLSQMKPSLLLWSAGYGPSPDKLRRIAPGMGFAFNDASGKPLTLARQSLIQLAERIGRVPQANQHLADFDVFMAAAKQRFAARVQRPLLVMSILDPRHALVFGKGSLFLEVMKQLGIENAWQGETNSWGSAIVGLERLATLRGVDAVCFDHGDDTLVAQVMATPLWQAMPFVRENRLRCVPQVWFYGTTLSAMRFCRLIDGVLETA
ncbi:Fe(3+)-hydroxamate ABC transporter substrate-binding protein FhuD [Erwinia tracheiphila]|uniref:Iron-hydroxamate transporter substrate-binding subunit n=1 Tax=Erwinia tracheiphila TaxID=65700 RepID=A0A0M2KKJ3_9GAMM|nr:Fe(3+)-hydroxamate ABC transporter substrate-binding protein FhuD [Erwinia tracheiphila]EOS95874.1 iron-hydroxamate transporter substrate-binding subunit [Erwinia tracheiphila PSU-1]KKF37506.1 iron-hydroxamate transporter substrate-binding subunit [Erwinia tracheiphila]UIA88911.1 Fe(3+)-hydroxamate ABC transporter substrate-binding protein FhuD [Erwinia tracheiphila]UIA97291.1 Fe(3+)-hydroxamate ABC transporter substrate-binding protein FhuD [Erwinia tracheiphila]